MARQKPNKDQLPLEGSRSTDDTYSDGHPFDQVQYLEAKLILKPDRFTSLKTFHQFGKVVRTTAEKLKVGFVPGVKAQSNVQIREVVFGDTSDFRLYNNSSWCVAGSATKKAFRSAILKSFLSFVTPTNRSRDGCAAPNSG